MNRISDGKEAACIQDSATSVYPDLTRLLLKL